MISRFTYLVVHDSHEDQWKVLASTPFYINKRTPIIVPWTADLDLNTIQVTEASVWVDLTILHIALEIKARDILAKLGRVVYNGAALT